MLAEKNLKTLFLLLMISVIMNLNAQDISKYKWENRLIIVIAKDEQTLITNDNIQEIENDSKGLKERKIKIFKVLPNSYNLDGDWFKSKKLYKLYNKNKEEFKFILIGLDGGIKIQESQPLSKNKLFAIIDAMPMRASELKNKQ